MSTVTKVKKILSDAIINRKKQKEKDYLYRLYKNQFKRYLLDLGYEDKIAPGEEEWINKWSVFGAKVEPYSFRLFSHYLNDVGGGYNL